MAVHTAPAPFGAITLHKIVVTIEAFFTPDPAETYTEALTNRQRADIGLLEKGAPVFVDPLVQIFAAARR